MQGRLIFDLQNDNFDYFFEKEASLMTEAQKELLPKELLYKLFVKGHRVNTKEAGKMSFLSKLYVLFKALKKRCIVIVEDDKNGMGEEEFFKWKKETSKQEYTQDHAVKFTSHASFILGNKELCNTFHRLNLLSTSPAYTYLSQTKNMDYTKPAQWLAGMNYINKFLSHYESNRKKITLQTGLNMAEWLVLIYLYRHESLVKGAPIYNEHYKYSYNTSGRRIRGSFSMLQTKGYIEKVGDKSGAKIRITALGRDKVNDIIKKFVVNC